MPTARKPVIVEVEWVDARSKYESMTFEEALKRCTLVHRLSVGYLLLKDRERVVIAHTYDPPEDEQDLESGDDWTVVPRGWVKRITELNPSTTEERGES